MVKVMDRTDRETDKIVNVMNRTVKMREVPPFETIMMVYYRKKTVEEHFNDDSIYPLSKMYDM
ncbi:hypothetical protein [Lysinibacillus cavernae]|uniref:hypothetical protein n=1 Tax=Lysinibacillus cavernae TaxID=2666135 RepID=UPI001E4E6AA5|nr:hypothetical protein [Lysinibacillus cavernae]